MRIAIYGAGAVGGYFGGRLAQIGEEVIFIARGANLEALKTQGLTVDSVKGNFHLSRVQATDHPEEAGVVDVILPCVKTWQIPEIALSMRPMLGPETIVVPLQNGVEAAAQFAQVLGAEHLLGGLVKLFTTLVAPGHVLHSGGPALFAFGELDNHPSERSQRLLQTLQRATGIAPEIPADIQAALWEKLLFIAAFGGIGAVTRLPIGVVRQLPETRTLLQTCMSEIDGVARAHGIQLGSDVVARTMAFIDTQPAAGTASMQRDIIAGRRSELDSLNGAVVRLGQQMGVTTPINTFVYHSLLPAEMLARGDLQMPA